jgi:hypothetical protein
LTKISHSARGKYDHCGQMYKLHYLDKIRPVGTTSSLLFGSAIDAAAEHYLLNGDKELCKQTFKNTWKEQEINGTLTDLKTCTEIEFHANDFDHELLTQSDNDSIIKDTVFKTTSDLVEDRTNKEKVTLANWVSLFRKGQLLINAFMEWVDERVEEVLEAQAVIELVDEEGNEITGKADFIIKMKGYDVPLLVDLKTAARYYERDSVKTSEQLALYYFFLRNTKYPEMKRAAYLVLQKQIKKNREKTCRKCGNVTTGKEQSCSVETESTTLITKGKNKGKPKMDRCSGEFDEQIFPEATIQFIHDEIPEHFIQETVEDFGVVIANIKAEKFEKNLDGCDSYYGRTCPYKKYCFGGCMDGLIKKEEKNG